MTDMPRIPRETPAQYAERHRRLDNDGRPDRVAELAADIEASVQRAIWGMTVEHYVDLTERELAPYGHEPHPPSGDHRPPGRALGFNPWLSIWC